MAREREREREREIECGGVSKGCTKWTMMVMARTEGKDSTQQNRNLFSILVKDFLSFSLSLFSVELFSLYCIFCL